MTKPSQKPEDEKQSGRFIEKAREIAGEDARDAFDRAIKDTLPTKTMDDHARPSGGES